MAKVRLLLKMPILEAGRRARANPKAGMVKAALTLKMARAKALMAKAKAMPLMKAGQRAKAKAGMAKAWCRFKMLVMRLMETGQKARATLAEAGVVKAITLKMAGAKAMMAKVRLLLKAALTLKMAGAKAMMTKVMTHQQVAVVARATTTGVLHGKAMVMGPGQAAAKVRITTAMPMLPGSTKKIQ